MSYPMPPLCAECGEVVPETAPVIVTRYATVEDEEGNEQVASPMLILHEACVTAFDAKHPQPSD